MSFIFHLNFLLFEKFICGYFQCARHFSIMVKTMHDELIVIIDNIMCQTKNINPAAVHQFQTDTVLAIFSASDSTLDKFDLDIPHERADIENFIIQMV